MEKHSILCLNVFLANQYAVASGDCNNSSGVHKEMVSCIQKQTAKYEVN